MDVTTPIKPIILPDLSDVATLLEGAEACYISGLSASACAPVLYQRYQPDANTFATTLLAVWTTTSQAELTTIMTPLYPASEVQAAVTLAFSYYLDIMIRDTLSDVGQIPYPGTDVYTSPDIYPVGTQPLADPSVLLDTWNQGPTSNIYWSSPTPVTNYIYVRTTNLFLGATPWYPQPGTGDLVPNQIYLYYSLASLVMMPSLWSQQSIPSASGQPPTITATTQGEHGVTMQAFEWVAQAPPSGDHYCLIARVVTSGHPNPIPQDGSLTSFSTYVRDNPSVAWRNVSVIYIETQQARAEARGLATPETPGIPTQASLIMMNPEPLEHDYTLQVSARNMPPGTTIQLRSACGLDLGPVTVEERSQTWQVTSRLVPRYDGSIAVDIVTPRDVPFEPGAEVSVINYAHAAAGTGLASFGRTPSAYGMSHETLGLKPEDVVVFVGNFDFQFANGADPYAPEGATA